MPTDSPAQIQHADTPMAGDQLTQRHVDSLALRPARGASFDQRAGAWRKSGEIGTVCNHEAEIEGLLTLLMESAGRKARRREPFARSGGSEMSERESAPKAGIYLGHGPVR
jgi:hypothetical protein